MTSGGTVSGVVTGTVAAIMGLPAVSVTEPDGIKMCCGAPISCRLVWFRTTNSTSPNGSHSASARVRLADSPRTATAS